jgi:hypothetical protein
MEMVLDIQDLQQGREPWSKAKRPDSPGGAAQTPTDSGRFLGLGPLAATATDRHSRRSATLQRSAADDLLANMRKKSFISAFLLVGLLIFGVRLEHLAEHQETLPQSAMKTAPPPPPSTAVTTPVKTAAAVAVNKHRKHPEVAGSHPSAVKVPGSISSRSLAMLEIEVDHKFADAHMSIWVDDLLTYTHPLEGIEKKRLVVFRHIQGHEFHAVQIPSGKHTLRVQVIPGGGISEQSATVDGDFPEGTEKMLRILFDKNGAMNLTVQ